jgi:hypothetical protein
MTPVVPKLVDFSIVNCLLLCVFCFHLFWSFKFWSFLFFLATDGPGFFFHNIFSPAYFPSTPLPIKIKCLLPNSEHSTLCTNWFVNTCNTLTVLKFLKGVIVVCDHMVVGFITTYCGEFESHSGEMYLIQHFVIKFVSDLQQVCGFLRFPPPIKLAATI